MTSELRFRGHIAELDGLRAVAVSLVLLTHFSPQTIVGSLLWKIESVGWMGVDLFFVLSGFLITGILVDAREKQFYYRNFYVRRILRIFPLYYAVLIGCTVLLDVWHLSPVRATLAEASWFFLYIGNFRTTVVGHLPYIGFLIPLWSLQIEEQFYLVFPCLVRKLTPTALVRLLIWVVVLSGPLRLGLYLWHPTRQIVEYVFFPCRIDGLALGALVALRVRRGPWNIRPAYATALAIAMLGILAGCLSLGGYEWNTRGICTFGYSVIALTFTAVLIWVLRFRDTRQTAWLRNGVVQYLGKISYGIYLLQIPAYLLARKITHHFGLERLFLQEWNWKAAGWEGFALVVTLAIMLASMSWYFFESPILRAKDGLTRTITPTPSRVAPSHA